MREEREGKEGEEITWAFLAPDGDGDSAQDVKPLRYQFCCVASGLTAQKRHMHMISFPIHMYENYPHDNYEQILHLTSVIRGGHCCPSVRPALLLLQFLAAICRRWRRRRKESISPLNFVSGGKRGRATRTEKKGDRDEMEAIPATYESFRFPKGCNFSAEATKRRLVCVCLRACVSPAR